MTDASTAARPAPSLSFALLERLAEEDRGNAEAQQAHLMRLLDRLRRSPVAIATREANEQHYELPCEFFEVVLGRNLKYSSGYFRPGVDSLDQAEADILALEFDGPPRFDRIVSVEMFEHMRNYELLRYFQSDVRSLEHWRVSSTHYQRTSEARLANMDRNRARIEPMLAATYGASEIRRW